MHAFPGRAEEDRVECDLTSRQAMVTVLMARECYHSKLEKMLETKTYKNKILKFKKRSHQDKENAL